MQPVVTEEQAYWSSAEEDTPHAVAPKRRGRATGATRSDKRSQQRAAPTETMMAGDVAAVVQSVLGFAPTSDQVSSKLCKAPQHMHKTCE